jgi:membrane-bound lytic murein transglycosylase D
MMAGVRLRRVVFASVLAATPIASMRSVSAGPGVIAPSPKERRAVRGRPMVELIESEDQATVRRFEASLPEAAAPVRGAVAVAAAAPPPADVDLAGSWHGSGDDVLPPNPATATPTPTAATTVGPLGELYVDFFSKDPAGSAVFARAQERLRRWWAPCEAALTQAGVPAEVAAASLALTGFETDAVGVNGEAGPWRLTATQARAAGLRVTLWIDERRDPVRATEAAAAHLASLHQRFGSWPLALLAHHAGSELVEQALQQVPTADLAQLTGAGGPLPRPARLFLAKLVALSQLGFPGGRFAAVAPTGKFVSVEVPGALTLPTIARASRVDVDEIRALNPALIGDRVAPFVAPVQVRLPAGTRKVSRAAIEESRGADDDVKAVALRLGESARALAASSGVPERELCRVNRVQSVNELRGAIDVLLPAGATVPAGEVPLTDRGLEGTDEPPLVAVPARMIDVPGRVRAFYFVVDGDNLDEIAQAAGVAVADIVGWNNLDARARLQSKMVLQLFVAPDLDRGRIALLDATQVRPVALGSDEFHALEVALRGKSRVVHSARLGDTLQKIARRYGLTAPDLARINRMSWNSELFDGQRIVVYAPSGGGARETAVGRSQHPKRRTSGR